MFFQSLYSEIESLRNPLRPIPYDPQKNEFSDDDDDDNDNDGSDDVISSDEDGYDDEDGNDSEEPERKRRRKRGRGGDLFEPENSRELEEEVKKRLEEIQMEIKRSDVRKDLRRTQDRCRDLEKKTDAKSLAQRIEICTNYVRYIISSHVSQNEGGISIVLRNFNMFVKSTIEIILDRPDQLKNHKKVLNYL